MAVYRAIVEVGFNFSGPDNMTNEEQEKAALIVLRSMLNRGEISAVTWRAD